MKEFIPILGRKIFFENEKLPFTIKGYKRDFVVATRKMHRRHDSDIIREHAKNRFPMSFKEAFEAIKDVPVYTIIDLRKNVRSSHNLTFNIYNFNNTTGIDHLLSDLVNGSTGLSQRNMVKFCHHEFMYDDQIDLRNLRKMAKFVKTIPQEKFNMFNYRRNDEFDDDHNRRHECETVGCIIGHCTVLDKLENIPVYGNGDINFPEWSETFTGIRIDSIEWDYLFSSHWQRIDNTTMGAYKRINQVIKYGRVPDNYTRVHI